MQGSTNNRDIRQKLCEKTISYLLVSSLAETKKKMSDVLYICK